MYKKGIRIGYKSRKFYDTLQIPLEGKMISIHIHIEV